MMPLIIICCYLALLLALGLFSSKLFKGTSKDYMLASHSIGPFLLLMSIFGTTMTAFALVGSTGEAFKEGVGVYGMLASSSGIIHSLCFFLLGMKLWSWGKRFGYTTQIQFFRDRLGSDKIGLLLFPILVGLVVPYLLIGVMAAGTVVNVMTAEIRVDGEVKRPGVVAIDSLPEWLDPPQTAGPRAGHTNGGVPKRIASLVICIVVLVYVFFGGMRGTAWANTFQTIVFMILGVVTFYTIAMKLGGTENFYENLKIASGAVGEERLTRMEMSKLKFATYMLVPLSVGMFPHLFQHWLTAKSASSFKLPVVAHPIFIMIVWVPCVLVGVWATSNLIVTPPNLNPNAVLPFMVKKLAGPVLGGFLTAGILAAVMSSLDSQFLSIGTMFTEDIVVHYGGKDRFSEKQTIFIARCFIIGIVALTYILALFEPGRVFTLGVWCFSGFSSLFPLVFTAVYWKKLTKWGAYACVIAAAGTWIYLFNDSLEKTPLGYAPNPDYSVNFVIGGEVYKTMPVLTMVLASTLAVVIVSLITPKPDRERLRRFFPKDFIIGEGALDTPSASADPKATATGTTTA